MGHLLSWLPLEHRETERNKETKRNAPTPTHSLHQHSGAQRPRGGVGGEGRPSSAAVAVHCWERGPC